MQGGTVRLPPPAYPSYFSDSINDQVARSLGFILPPEADLEKRLEGRDCWRGHWEYEGVSSGWPLCR